MKEFKLDNHPKIKPGFIVPEKYFEDFSARVMAQIGMPEPKVVSLHKHSWIYAAAAVLALALAIPGINMVASVKNRNETLALENYIAYAGISNEEIVELLETEDIEKIKIDYPIDEAQIEDALYSGPDAENYIID